MLRLTIHPHDVSFFRTSRPFGGLQAAASDGEAELLPEPQVVFGAIRTAVGEVKSCDWKQYLASWQAWERDGLLPTDPLHRRLGPPTGGNWPTDCLSLGGVLPVRTQPQLEVLFPLPAFVLSDKADGVPHRKRLAAALPTPTDVQTSAGPLRPLRAQKREHKYRFLLVGQSGFGHLLRAGAPQTIPTAASLLKPDALAEVERRIGIARDVGRRTVQEGRLYTLQVHRWRSRVPFSNDNRAFGLQVLVYQLAPEQLRSSRMALHLGGERRLAWAEAGPGKPWLDDATCREIEEKVGATGRWFLTLATAAAFAQGWHPKWLQSNRAVLNGIDCGQLVSMAGDAPRTVSGWDLARECPKPVRRLLPAGTTWFFELPPDGASEAVRAALRTLQGSCIADEDAHMGCGLAFVGAWTKETN